MERLLKTLRYNFLTEALDFVGVHQERTLQVRAVYLTEGDAQSHLAHMTVGLGYQCPHL